MGISSVCKLPDLAHAMVSNLDVIIDSLDEVGITTVSYTHLTLPTTPYV